MTIRCAGRLVRKGDFGGWWVRFEGEREDRYCSTGGISGRCFELCKVLPSAEEQTSEEPVSEAPSAVGSAELHDTSASAASTLPECDGNTGPRARPVNGGWVVGVPSAKVVYPPPSPPALPPRLQPASNPESVRVPAPLVASNVDRSPGSLNAGGNLRQTRVIQIKRCDASPSASARNSPSATHQKR